MQTETQQQGASTFLTGQSSSDDKADTTDPGTTQENQGEKGNEGTPPPDADKQQQEQQKTTDPKDPGEGDKDKGAEASQSELELKVPDGVEVDAGTLNQFKEVAKEAGVKGPHAQKILDLYVNAQKSWFDAVQQAGAQRMQQWTESLKTDKELGGQNSDTTRANVDRVMKAYATPELRALLDESGFGNHPELVRFVSRIGKAIAEDTVAGTSEGGPAGRATDEEGRLRQLYPNSPELFAKP